MIERAARYADFCGSYMRAAWRKKLQVVGRHLLENASKSNQQVTEAEFYRLLVSRALQVGNEITSAMRESNGNQQRIGWQSARGRRTAIRKTIPICPRLARNILYVFGQAMGVGLPP